MNDEQYSEEEISPFDWSDYYFEDLDLLEKGYAVATYNYECKIYNEMERVLPWPQ